MNHASFSLLFFFFFCSGSSAIPAQRPTFFQQTWLLPHWWSSRPTARCGGRSPSECLTSRGDPTQDRARTLTKPTLPYIPPSSLTHCRYLGVINNRDYLFFISIVSILWTENNHRIWEDNYNKHCLFSLCVLPRAMKDVCMSSLFAIS